MKRNKLFSVLSVSVILNSTILTIKAGNYSQLDLTLISFGENFLVKVNSCRF